MNDWKLIEKSAQIKIKFKASSDTLDQEKSRQSLFLFSIQKSAERTNEQLKHGKEEEEVRNLEREEELMAEYIIWRFNLASLP